MSNDGMAAVMILMLAAARQTLGYVIPRGMIAINEETGAVYSVKDDNDPFNKYPEGYGEDELDMDIMLFSLITMVLMYVFVCFLYIFIKYIVNKLMRDNSSISLLNDGDTNRRLRRTTEQLNARWPSALDNEEYVKDKLAKLSPEEQFYYKQGEEYIRQNPPLIIPHASSSDEQVEDPIVNESTRQFINEEGAYAWEFQPDSNLPNDTVIVENKTEVTFLNYNYEASVMTNLPIPRINRVYYCEFKIFELRGNSGTTSSGSHHLEDDETISFGLSTCPYPYFRLPGKHHHSIAYDSNGSRRFNDSFALDPALRTLFPRLEKGDVVGIGYRSNSGTVFFTRNGKKLKEDSVGGHIKGWKFKYLYPIIGANVPCKIHVNFGTYGFVYIEANVKKWGYAKTSGMKLPPPSYEEYGQDTLLESGCEEDLTDNESTSSINGDIVDSQGELLPPPPGFEYSTSPIDSTNAMEEAINLNSLPAEPPSYSDDEISSRIKSDAPRIGSSSSQLVEEGDSNDQNGYVHDEEEDDEMNIEESGHSRKTNGNTLSNQFIQD
ncbi:hypothetical protein HG536_0A02650 [Torulaspora globosa]|uniref:B30.2/SPRY domain-containing protein n=1 Tax=Torulaspora globosa TaxID=48254 RepID=A0A7G3ZAB2_9SACH|nr:uncharacterized protein HG536_0A02650 [Torulaspora globosa]QLL30448.1 hypothetical protein HG536_0A02650 [Torulaspora globosa]